MHGCQGHGTTSFTNLLGEGNWGRSIGSRGAVTVSAAWQGVLSCQPDLLSREEKLPRRRGSGWGLGPHTALGGSHGSLPPGRKGRARLEHGSKELGMVPRSRSAWRAGAGRSQGQQESGGSRALGLKMQFFFFVQPSGVT